MLDNIRQKQITATNEEEEALVGEIKKSRVLVANRFRQKAEVVLELEIKY